MLPDNFNFALLPSGSSKHSLRSLGMLASTLENIDMALTSWVKDELDISVLTNEGFTKVPMLWQAPERSFQIKNRKELRDDAGALKLPFISVERSSVVKDPNRKGGFQANYYSNRKNGRSGRWVIARKIVEDKTNNFATVANVRDLNQNAGTRQLYYPRTNKKIVVQSLSVPIPVYINIDYKITLKAEYQQQMNEMLAPFITRTGQINSFIMRRNGHLYEAFFEQNFASNNNVADLQEEMRMFSTDITIKVLGYLIGEGESDDRPIVHVEENAVEITYPQEQVAPPGIPNLFGEIKK